MTHGQEKSSIADRRKRLGWSTYRLAKQAGILWHTARDIDEGRRRPQSRTLEKIEDALAAAERET